MKPTIWRILGILSLLLATAGLWAQTSSNNRTFQAALTGGVNLAQIDGDLLRGFHKIGLTAGARVGVDLSERWMLSFELQFSQQGSRRVVGDGLSSVFDRIHLNVVDVPVMIHLRDWKVMASAGLSYGRLINYRIRDIQGEDATDSYNLNPAMVSVVLGGTYFFKENLGLNIQWSRYLNDLQADDSGPVFIGRMVTVRTILLL